MRKREREARLFHLAYISKHKKLFFRWKEKTRRKGKSREGSSTSHDNELHAQGGWNNSRSPEGLRRRRDTRSICHREICSEFVTRRSRQSVLRSNDEGKRRKRWDYFQRISSDTIWRDRERRWSGGRLTSFWLGLPSTSFRQRREKDDTVEKVNCFVFSHPPRALGDFSQTVQNAPNSSSSLSIQTILSWWMRISLSFLFLSPRPTPINLPRASREKSQSSFVQGPSWVFPPGVGLGGGAAAVELKTETSLAFLLCFLFLLS